MGRRSYEAIVNSGHSVKEFGMKAFVASTTLHAAEHHDVTVIAGDLAKAVGELKQKSGKDIWLFGGGGLFRSLLDAGLVDRVDVSLIPVLLGGGVPLVPPGPRRQLVFKDSRTFPSGIVSLSYGVGKMD
jgi:dihydrofolate reductase